MIMIHDDDVSAVCCCVVHDKKRSFGVRPTTQTGLVSIWESLVVDSWIVVHHVFETDIMLLLGVLGMPSFAQEVWVCVFDSRSVVCVFHHAVSGEGERTATTRTG